VTSARELFEKARAKCRRPNHAPSVALIMTLEMRDEITADPDLHQFLLMHGALPVTETWIKKRERANPHERSVGEEQLTMAWPLALRPLIEQIDRDALFVPSRDEYVPLQFGLITKPELVEAGAYLRAHAADTIRIAVLVERLVRELP
jgi:hypothetical protein